MNIITTVQSYLANEIAALNSSIISGVAADEELIALVSTHLSKSGGKRLRPILTILTAKMFGHEGNASICLGAAVEFIHMATLLHDDVVDGSKLRRFLPTANTIWGSKASILVGDYLFSQSFKLIVSTKLLAALEILSSASAIIAEGEVSQFVKLKERRIISIEEYFKVIEAKTAQLFSAACSVGVVAAGQDEGTVQLMSHFGRCLGKLFQIRDDQLDYFSDASITGKNIGDDFYEGKVTLPFILLARCLPTLEAKKLHQMLVNEARTNEDFLWVRDAMVSYDIAQHIDSYVHEIKAEAIKALDNVSSGDVEVKNYLYQILDFASDRCY